LSDHDFPVQEAILGSGQPSRQFSCLTYDFAVIISLRAKSKVAILVQRFDGTNIGPAF
jgi:hypothetical protein